MKKITKGLAMLGSITALTYVAAFSVSTYVTTPLQQELDWVKVGSVQPSVQVHDNNEVIAAFTGTAGAEYVLLKQAIVEEAGEDLAAGASVVFDSVINRVAHPDHPDSVEAVLKQYAWVTSEDGSRYKIYQYSYWADDVHPPITGAQGDLVDQLIAERWVAYQAGVYTPKSPARWFATDWSYQKWHARNLDCVGFDGLHYQFTEPADPTNLITCDRFRRPVTRPDDLLVTTGEVQPSEGCAPTTSMRPRLRPDNLAPQQSQDPVGDLLASLDLD